MTVRLVVPEPDLQIAFAAQLDAARSEFLQDALRETVRGLDDIAVVDAELARFADHEALKVLAGKGLRGEIAFAVPTVLQARPKLLSYYRLLLGVSQKSLYKTGSGFQPFKRMELDGKIAEKAQVRLEDLCVALSTAARSLILGLAGVNVVADTVLDDLTLLQLGQQWKGGANVLAGQVAIERVFKVVAEAVADAIVERDDRQLLLVNRAGRDVRIAFAPDPDIVIDATMESDEVRRLLAIEVKGGTDFSNIHNRIGEAEKSHQKARGVGYTECWTVVNVQNLDMKMACRESPSTSRFYVLTEIESQESASRQDFRSRVRDSVGL